MAVAIRVGFGGAIPDYATLVRRVSEWLDRDDLAPQVPVYIGLLEARLNRILRVPQMETVVMLSATGQRVPLPSDFLQMRHLEVGGFPIRNLSHTVPATAARDFSGRTGAVRQYMLTGDAITLFPPPNDTTSLTLRYYRKLPPLSDAVPINWLLEGHPDIYLYGTLMQAAAEVDDPAKVEQWKLAHDEALGELQAQGASQRFGGAPIAPRTAFQVSSAPC